MTTTTAHRPRRRLGAVVGDALLTVAALGGVLCIVLVVLAVAFDITLMMFKTGSMAPTIPAGSVAVVREVAASEVEVGDIVTVDRPGALPVTHRVTSVEAGENAAGRVITMRGDANATDDPFPYTVTTVRVVLASAPGLAHVIVWFSNPYVLGGITMGAALLVGWAFWPRRGTGSPSSRRPRHLAAAGATVLVGVTVLGPAPPAHAAPVTEVVRGTHLTLTSTNDPARMRDMRPGETVRWDVDVAVDAPDPGRVAVVLTGAGTLRLEVDARSCDGPWRDGTCPGTETRLAAGAAIPLDGADLPLEEFSSEEGRWIRLAVTLPAGASPDPGATTDVRVRADGSSGSVSVTPPGDEDGDGVPTYPGGEPAPGAGGESGPGGGPGALPTTGASLALPALLAVGAVVCGLLAARLARRGPRETP
ncbi:signal peptidase I [Georgenia alba]|uniref:Signal peptidase I n=1 Tax=Georgenia alba TaxID=2233858 RepID=A0ABW2QCG2_9MICO